MASGDRSESSYSSRGFFTEAVVRSFLLTWNPLKGSWSRFKRDLESLRRGRTLLVCWSSGARKDLPVGSRVFFMRLGGTNEDAKGLIGIGVVVREPYQGSSWNADATRESALYIDVNVTSLSEAPFLSLSRLRSIDPTFDWTPRASGIEIPAKTAARLVKRCSNILSPVTRLAEELDPSTPVVEGAVRTVRVNAYERSREARDTCINHHGTTCSACGLDFGERYGALGEGVIHVHHIKPLAEVGAEYEVDPIKDLLPVCPNCHTMIHRSSPPLSIRALKAILKRAAKRSR